jgi:alkylated DNA repair protein alkB family protein 8
LKEKGEKLEKQILTKEKVLDKERKTVVYKRYYHVFWKNELEDLIKQIEGLEVVESYFDHANWCVKVKKL